MSDTNLKVIFFGSDAICLPALRYLNSLKTNNAALRAVVSQPDRPSGRGQQLQPNPVAAWARAEGIELLQPEKPDANLVKWIEAEGIKLSLVMAYGHFLPQQIREATPSGMVNFHGSILPALRGASPVETALATGQSETGVSLMEVVREMDAGGVADLERVAIESTDTSVSLRAKIGEAVVPLLERNLTALMSGTLTFKPQDLEGVTYCRKINRSDGALDFSMSAALLESRLRAFTPWPGGYFDYLGVRIKVGSARAFEGASGMAPGTVVSADETGVQVATTEGILALLELQRPGGKMLSTDAFLRGMPIEVGSILNGAPAEPLVRRVF